MTMENSGTRRSGNKKEVINHEQHIRAARCAASCRSHLESQWEIPKFDTRSANTIGGGVELKIGRFIYLWGLTKRVKFQICKHSGGHLGDGVNYTVHYLGV